MSCHIKQNIRIHHIRLIFPGMNMSVITIPVSEAGLAALEGRDVELRELHQRFGGSIHAPDSEGATPLHLASERGHVHILRLLVYELGADSMALDNNRASVLHYAVQTNQVKVVEFLVNELGLDVNFADARGRTAVLLAATGGFTDLLLLLVTELRANCHAVDVYNHSAMFCAAWNGHNDAITALARFGVSVGAADGEGATAVHAAAHSGFASTLTLLVKHLGAQPNSADNFGYSPLHCAAAGGHTACAFVLVHELGSHVDSVDADGWTSLMHCVEQGDVATTKALLELGACVHVAAFGNGATALTVSRARLSSWNASHERAATSALPPPATPVASARPNGAARWSFAEVTALLERVEALQKAAKEGRVGDVINAIEKGRAFAPAQWLPLVPVEKRRPTFQGEEGGSGGGINNSSSSSSSSSMSSSSGSSIGSSSSPRAELLRWTSGVVGDSRACFLALFGPTQMEQQQWCDVQTAPLPRFLAADFRLEEVAHTSHQSTSQQGHEPAPFQTRERSDPRLLRRISRQRKAAAEESTRRLKKTRLSALQEQLVEASSGGVPVVRRVSSGSCHEMASALSDYEDGTSGDCGGLRLEESSSRSLLRLVVHDGQPLVRQRIASFLVHLDSPEVRAMVRLVHSKLAAEEALSRRATHWGLQQAALVGRHTPAYRLVSWLVGWVVGWLPPQHSDGPGAGRAIWH
jgi:ankyrin repeat protein